MAKDYPEVQSASLVRSETDREGDTAIDFAVAVKFVKVQSKKKAEELFKSASKKAMEIYNDMEAKHMTGKVEEKENKKGTVYSVQTKFKGMKEEDRARQLFDWLKDDALLAVVGQRRLDDEE